jgi:ribosomal protein S27AE
VALVVQPTGSPEAYQHYNDTIESPVLISKAVIRDLLGPDYDPIMKIFNPEAFISEGHNRVPMWGIVPSKTNNSKYEKLSVGDRVVFSRNKKIFCTGKVSYKFENHGLSKHLWGLDDNGAAWSLMYTLTDIEETDITYSEFNATVGYAKNAIIQGFNVLSDEKSKAFETKFFSKTPKAPLSGSGHWTDLFPPAWLLITQEGKPNPLGNVGNFGYEDIVDEAYRFDSLVGNSKQISEGDIVVLRSHNRLLGMGRISKIEQEKGLKELNRCPSCGKTAIKERKEATPRYRCGKCKSEFSEPILDQREVTKYTAWYGEGYVPLHDAIPVSQIRLAMQSPMSQQSIARLDCSKLLTMLLREPFETTELEEIRQDDHIPKIEDIRKEELIPLTQEMIPLSSEGASSNGDMLRILADGVIAKCYIDDSNPQYRIEILFEDEHSRFFDYFSATDFLFSEPGVMEWGLKNDTIQMYAFPTLPTDSRTDPLGYFHLTISDTQLEKSTINANKYVRDALQENGLIDYSEIIPGEPLLKPCKLIFGETELETEASFIIPKRRAKTSPERRFWPRKLNRYAKPGTELYFLAHEERLIVSDTRSALED